MKSPTDCACNSICRNDGHAASAQGHYTLFYAADGRMRLATRRRGMRRLTPTSLIGIDAGSTTSGLPLVAVSFPVQVVFRIDIRKIHQEKHADEAPWLTSGTTSAPGQSPGNALTFGIHYLEIVGVPLVAASIPKCASIGLR
jgi:hypothetical protein